MKQLSYSHPKSVFTGETTKRPSVRQLMDWCGISRRTAQRWLSGKSTPTKGEYEYVMLVLNGRVMPDAWPNHWKFNHKNLLEFESCFPAISYQQLTWYGYIIQSWYESMRSIPGIMTDIEYLMKRLPKADVIQLSEYREKLNTFAQQATISIHDIGKIYELSQNTEELIKKLEHNFIHKSNS